jgi:hypothetical protein
MKLFIFISLFYQIFLTLGINIDPIIEPLRLRAVGSPPGAIASTQHLFSRSPDASQGTIPYKDIYSWQDIEHLLGAVRSKRNVILRRGIVR